MPTERLPMGLRIALSAEQLKDLGVPDDMGPSDVEECLDRALLADPESLRVEIQQWIEDHENER